MLIQTILKTRRINNHYTQEQIAQKIHVTTSCFQMGNWTIHPFN